MPEHQMRWFRLPTWLILQRRGHSAGWSMRPGTVALAVYSALYFQGELRVFLCG